MSINDFRITKGIGQIKRNKLEPVTHNTQFCNELINKSRVMSSFADESMYDTQNTLVYAVNNNGLESEALQMIIDLLMQLRAAQDGQNVILNTNAVVKQQIIEQLKREFTNVQGSLTKNQIQQFNAIYNNKIDEKALSELIASLLSSTKKKLDKGISTGLHKTAPKLILGKDILNYSNFNNKIINTQNRYQTILSNVIENVSVEKLFNKNKIVHKEENIKELIEKTNVELEKILQNKVSKRYTNVNLTNILEQTNDIYKEKLTEKINLLPKTVDRNIEILKSEYTQKYDDVINKVAEKKKIIKYTPKVLPSKEIIEFLEEEENKNVLINDKHSLYNFIKKQSEKAVIYDNVSNVFSNKLIKSRDIISLHNEINKFETSLLNKYAKILYNKEQNIYSSSRDVQVDLINRKNISEVYSENENILLKQQEKINIKEEINKYYKETLAKDKKITKRNVTNVDVNKLLKGNITEDIIKENKIITHYNNLANKTVNKVLLNNYSILNEFADNEIINKRSIEEYSKAISRVHNRIVDSSLEKTYNQNITNLDNIQKKYTKLFKVNRNILSSNNILNSESIKNVINDRFVNKTNLINKKDIKNISQEEYLEEIIKQDKNFLEENIEKKYKNKIFNIDTSIKNTIINKEIENRVKNRYNQIESNVIDSKSIKNIVVDKNLINRQNINKSQIENIELDLQNIKEQSVTQNIEKKYRSKVNTDNKLLENKILNRVKVLDDIRTNIHDRLINTTNKVLETKNIVNRDVNNQERIIRKLGSTLNEDTINEKINNISEKIISNSSIVNTVRNKIKNINNILLKQENIKSRNTFENEVIINKDTLLVNKNIINENVLNNKVKEVSESIIENLSIVNEVKDKVKVAQKVYNIIEKKYSEDIGYFVPPVLKKNITNVYNVDKFIPSKKINLLSPEVIRDERTVVQENNIYNNTVENQRVYYNDMVEDVGRERIVRDNRVVNIDNFHEKLGKQDIVYKKPIKLPEIENNKKESSNSDNRKNIREVPKTIENRNVPFEFGTKDKKNKEPGITKKEVEKIVQSYISNIKFDNISKMILNKVENKMRMDRRRSGIV